MSELQASPPEIFQKRWWGREWDIRADLPGQAPKTCMRDGSRAALAGKTPSSEIVLERCWDAQ